jgi:xylulokinase
MFTIGLDIGSSSVKACLYDTGSYNVVGSSTSPTDEMLISSPIQGWAEQDPELWWHHVVVACSDLRRRYPSQWMAVRAIGIGYQMHGLVSLDADGNPVRPSIIWCDSRAVETGNSITEHIGRHRLLESNLNTPGNFTASKMVWMMENEPDAWSKTTTVMLPGDYVAYRLTGDKATSTTGLSEMALWDFLNHKPDNLILNYIYNIKPKLPRIVPTIGFASVITHDTAAMLGLSQDVAITYRSGDQPNNAFGLGVVDPGSVAMNAGTSGVVYAVTDRPVVDEAEAFNPFLHVTDTELDRRIGLLLCLNGCGILNARIRRLTKASSYEQMNELAQEVPLGSEGLQILPFGNGAERMLGNRNPGASVHGWDLVRHGDAHFYRASLEGIAATLSYGIDHMRSLGVQINKVHAGRANLFLSPVFCDLIASIARVEVYLYESDGSSAAAKGAGYGAGLISASIHPSQLLDKPTAYLPGTGDESSVERLRKEYYEKISSILKHNI